jgi:hypothetical protein
LHQTRTGDDVDVSVNVWAETGVSDALDAILSCTTAVEAAAVAQHLLQGELEALDWPPLGGALVVWAALNAAEPAGPFMHVVCTYLSLHFQELDDTIVRCRELIDHATSQSLVQARISLLAGVQGLEGIRL